MSALDRQGIDVALRQEDGTFVFRLSGELDIDTADTLSAAVRDAVGDDEHTPVVLDFGDLRFCDSSGLAAILRMHARFGRERFAVRGGGPAVRRVFQLAGVEGMLRFEDPS